MSKTQVSTSLDCQAVRGEISIIENSTWTGVPVRLGGQIYGVEFEKLPPTVQNNLRNTTLPVDEKSTWVMNCTVPNLKEACLNILQKIDDLQQKAGDQNEAEMQKMLTESYNFLDETWRKFHCKNMVVAGGLRNEIRMHGKFVNQCDCMLNDEDRRVA